jgi:hypothetical protein
MSLLPRWAIGFSLAPWLLTASAQEQLPTCCDPEWETLSQRQAEALVEKTEPILAPCCADILHLKGTVVLAISVDSDGNVTCVKVISGPPLMFGVTIESVRHWKFRPYTSLAAKKSFCGQLALHLEANEHGVNFKIVLAPPAYPSTTNSQNPYPNELKRFKFYARYLNPLRPYVSDRDLVINVLGDSAGVDLTHWRIQPLFVGEGSSINDHSWAKNVTGRLAEVAIRPRQRVSLLNVKFPSAFTHTYGSVSEINVSCDVYHDDFGLEYWIYAEDSPAGKKGDLMEIRYGPSESTRREVEGPAE